MKHKITSVVLLICLLCPNLLPFQTKVHASSSMPKIKLLEITDGATESTLSPSQKSEYDVITIPVKKFVADRTELEGKYDAIYFAAGTYSTDIIRLDPDPTNSNPDNILYDNANRKANNLTKTKMNDLTVLKATEITDYYIKRNLPVYFHDSVKYQACNTKLKPNYQCVLKNLAQNYVKSEYPNVSYISGPASISTLNTNRPRFQVTSMPTDSATATTPYKSGDIITYKFTIDKGNPSDLTANLYIDSNFNTKYEPSELVKQEYVKNLGTAESGYTLKYNLPKGYSGIRMWKLEISSQNGLKDYKTGNLLFRDVKVDIHVLQVTKTNSQNGSLLKVLNQVGRTGNVIDTEDYRMTIDVVSMSDFNNNAYQKLNTGLYNMIVFGFEDSYGNVRITNTNAQKAVNDFIESGQSIFFTHDTIQRIPASGSRFEVTNSWIQNFLPETGQTLELGVASDWNSATEQQKLQAPGKYYMETNIGYQATYTINKAKKVNNALITSFPYPLAETISLATTHSQYFALDLEDPEVIPLYNLSNPNDNAMDSNDSYNMYYIYKRKNITYSGAGHTSSTFSLDEQKLFVNTMLASFIGANQAPTITVNSPDTSKEIPTTQNIPLSFKVDDIDLNDMNLNYSILLNGVQIKTGTMLNGQTISEEISHGLVNDGTSKITIKAWDLKGAQAGQKDIVVTIKKLNENLSISRSVSTASILKVGKDRARVTYTITPNVIDGSKLNNNIQTLKVNNIVFKETVPANFEVNSSLSNFKIVQNADNTKTITSNLGSITYTRNANDQYIANSVSFAIEYTPTIMGDYTLAKSILEFTSVDNTDKTLVFNHINVNARDELKGIKTPDSITMNINNITPQKILVDYDPTNALSQGIIKNTTWQVVEGSHLISVSGSGEVSIKPGALINNESTISRVKVTVTDIFGNVKEAIIQVNITNPLQTILVDERLTLNVGETGSLHLVVVPTNAVNRLKWTIDHPEFVEIDKLTGIVKGLEKGTTTVNIKGIGENNKEIIKTVVITVKQPVTSIRVDSPILLNVGDPQLNLLDKTTVLPTNANNKAVVFSLVSSTDKQYVELTEGGLLTAISMPPEGYSIKVKVGAVDASNVFAETVIKIVGIAINGITLPDKLDLRVGDRYNLTDRLQYIPYNTTQKGISSWQSDHNQFLSVNSSGIIEGISAGDSIVTAISTFGNYKASILIHVYDVELTGIRLPARLDLKVGDDFKLNSLLEYLPENTTQKGISGWKSSDNRFVTVDSNGKIEANSKGYATITATTTKGNKKASIYINVYDPKDGNNGNSGKNLKW